MKSGGSLRVALLVALLFAVALASACGGSEDRRPSGGAAKGAPAGAGAPGGAAAAGERGAWKAVPDTVVAEVNGQPIRTRKLLGVLDANRQRQAAMGRPVSPEAEKAMRQGSLDALVADELLFQAARSEGVTPPEADVDAEMASLRTGFASEEEFRKYLAEEGIAEDQLRAEAVRRVTVREMLKSISGKATVQESDARKFYDANTEMFREGEQVRAQIIVVLSKPDDSEQLKADARRRIEEAHKRALAGEDFAALAKQYSQVSSAAKGGDLGFFPKGAMMPAIEQLAFSSPIGQISPVFETPTGLNFLKVLERRESRVRPFEEVKAPLLVDLGKLQETAIVQEKLRELREKATVTVLDPTFLEPEGSPAEGEPASAPGTN